MTTPSPYGTVCEGLSQDSMIQDVARKLTARLGGSCVHVADHNFKAGEESRVILKQYSINSTVLNSRQAAEAFQTCPAAMAYTPYLLRLTVSCDLCWREAEASVERSTLPSQGVLVVFQGLRLNSRQITHHVQYINAPTARLLSHK
jgi:hypothetical protein